MAKELFSQLQARGVNAWFCSAWEEDEARSQVEGSRLVFSVGGDGTILRSVRIVAPHAVPIVGVNLGQVGFMTDVNPKDLYDLLPGLLRGEGRVEERAMLSAELLGYSNDSDPSPHTYTALNDVVVGRGRRSRLVKVQVSVDGVELPEYRVDTLIVATATGSTGYSMAAGGPILHPSSPELIITPVAPHLCIDRSLVLPGTAVIEMTINTDHEAMISFDGQIDVPLDNGDKVRVKKGPHVARFLRTRPEDYYYRDLGKLMGRSPEKSEHNPQ
jgi:NAD+ kinase